MPNEFSVRKKWLESYPLGIDVMRRDSSDSSYFLRIPLRIFFAFGKCEEYAKKMRRIFFHQYFAHKGIESAKVQMIALGNKLHFSFIHAVSFKFSTSMQYVWKIIYYIRLSVLLFFVLLHTSSSSFFCDILPHLTV